jgi:hypothetical protein
MRAVCAWCGKDMGEREPLEDKSLTHGICRPCQEREFRFRTPPSGAEPVRNSQKWPLASHNFK